MCKKLSLNTFSLGEWCVNNWASGNLVGESHGMIPSKNTKLQMRNERSPSIKRKPDATILTKFLDSIPKLTSHYCRRDNSKIFFEPIYGNRMSDVYKEYKKLCSEHPEGSVVPLSICSFHKVINKGNFSFQPPKKDKCDKCIMFVVI